jgi:hypothetical protein
MDSFISRSTRAAAVVVIATPLCACTQLFVRADWDAQPRWKPLKPVLFEVRPSQLAENCGIALEPAQVLYGCARRDYWIGACLIFTAPHPEAWLLEHERKHCAGWDHGSSRLAQQ